MLGYAKLWYTIMLYIKRNKVGVEEKEEEGKGRRIQRFRKTDEASGRWTLFLLQPCVCWFDLSCRGSGRLM